MTRSKLRVSPKLIEEWLYDYGDDGTTRVVGADYDAVHDVIVLVIEGPNVPDSDECTGIVEWRKPYTLTFRE